MNLPLFLFGYCRMETDRKNVTPLLNLCLRENLTLTNFQTREDGGICFCTGWLSALRLSRACKKNGIPVRVSRGGLPRRLLLLSRRTGLLLGMLAGAFLLFFSQKFVWSVRVKGNETVTAGQIRSVLAENGLEVGAFLPKINLSEIEIQTLLSENRLSWIAVHMNGTVAEVQVVERMPVTEKNDHPANLIAKSDGQIEELELYRGRAMVHVGQPVRKGELLVSGVYDSQTVGYRYTRAAGRVLARTEQQICVEIPLVYTEKEYTSPVNGGFEFQFFKFSFNFFKNSRNAPATCDIIESTTGKDWLGLHDLPVSASKTTYLPYTETQKERSAEQALELAYGELDRKLSQLSPEVQLLEKRIQTNIGEQSLVLECTLVCVENIALQRDFDVS